MARFDGGWFRFDRRVLSGDIADRPMTLALWIHLLGMANTFESSVRFDGTQVRLRPGSILTGVRELAVRTNIPRSTVQRSLDYLEASGRISQTIGTQGRIVTICKWRDYQSAHESDGTQTGHERDTSGTPAGHERALNEQYNNIQSNDVARFESRMRFDLESLFSLYPRHEKKGQALRLLAENIKTDEDFSQWKRAIENYARHVDMNETERRYILTFPNFVLEWTDWRDWKTPAVKPRQSLTGIVER